MTKGIGAKVGYGRLATGALLVGIGVLAVVAPAAAMPEPKVFSVEETGKVQDYQIEVRATYSCSAAAAEGSKGVKKVRFHIQNPREKDADTTLVEATCDGEKRTAAAMLPDMRTEPDATEVGACLTTRDGRRDPDAEGPSNEVCLSNEVWLTLSDSQG